MHHVYPQPIKNLYCNYACLITRCSLNIAQCSVRGQCFLNFLRLSKLQKLPTHCCCYHILEDISGYLWFHFPTLEGSSTFQ